MEKKKLYEAIDRHRTMALKATSSYRAASMSMACLDLTSLSGKETAKDIEKLCRRAKEGRVAAVCVYPDYVRQASQELNSTDIAIATVINFPQGANRNNGERATEDTTREDILSAISDGATEIDIVADYEAFKSMNIGAEESVREILTAARDACGDQVKLKVILESASFTQEAEIYDMAMVALECGADMIKTSTGKYVEDEGEPGGATLDAVAAMAMAVRNYNDTYGQERGLKISGGINGQNYAQYVELTRNILDTGFLKPQTFRFGASGIYDDLKLVIDHKGQIEPRPSSDEKPSQRKKRFDAGIGSY